MNVDTNTGPPVNTSNSVPTPVPTQYLSPQPTFMSQPSSSATSPSLPPTVPTTTFSARPSNVPPNQIGNSISNFFNTLVPQQQQQQIPPQQMAPQQHINSNPQQMQMPPQYKMSPQPMNNPMYIPSPQSMQMQRPMQQMSPMQQMPPMQPQQMPPMQQRPPQQFPMQQQMPPQHIPTQQQQQFVRPPMQQMPPQQFIPQQHRMMPMNGAMSPQQQMPQQQPMLMNKPPMYMGNNTVPPNNIMLMRPPVQQQPPQYIPQQQQQQRMMTGPLQQVPQPIIQQHHSNPSMSAVNTPPPQKSTSMYGAIPMQQPQHIPQQKPEATLNRSNSVHIKQPLPPLPPKSPLPTIASAPKRSLPTLPPKSSTTVEDDSMVKSLQAMELQDNKASTQDIPISTLVSSNEDHLTLKKKTSTVACEQNKEEETLLLKAMSINAKDKTVKQYLQSLYGDAVALDQISTSQAETDENIVVEQDSITLEQWIKIITGNDSQQQQELLSLLVLTYPSFVSTRKELWNQLWQRFHMTPSKLLSQLSQMTIEQAQQFKKEELDPIRLKLILFFKYWIKNCFAYEFATPVLQQELQDQWLPWLEKNQYNALATVLKKALQEASDEWNQKMKPLKASDCPASLKPKKSLFKKEDDIWKYPAQEIARQICIIEFNEYFSKIEPKEWCNSAWDKTNRATQAIHLSQWSNWFVKLQQWISTCILEMDTLPKRVKRMEQCIELALQLIQCNNWNAAVAVVTGLTCKSIARLSGTIAALSETNRQTYENLKTLIQKDDNFANLRQQMEHVMLPAIPYLGIYISPLAYIESHFKTLDNRNRIQLTKCKKLHQIISEIQYYQIKRFQFLEIHELKQALLHVRAVDEEQQYTMSLKVESSTHFLTTSTSFLNTNNSKLNTSNHSSNGENSSDSEAENEGCDHLQKALQQSVSKQYILDYEKLVFSTNQFLGSGARGTVYKGSYYLTPVAVKLFTTSRYGISSTVEELQDFFNEARFLCEHSNHPNVVRFIGVAYNKQSSQLALATELCSNGDIGVYCERNPVPWDKKLQICFGIASGMAHLHSVNIIHRDLKCDNILLDNNLVPKIIDFGFSKQVLQHQQQNMTMNVGTAAFCAPEVIGMQASGASAYDSKCDVYSFAIIMYVIYTDNPFPYGKQFTDMQLLYYMAQNPQHRPSLPESIPEEHQWYIDLMMNCWDANPEKRPTFEMIAKIFLEKIST